jgi:hypothetical protein
MKRIVLDCSDETRGCEHCVLHRDYGCVAPGGLDDCYKYQGVWVVEEVKDDSRN